MNDLMTLGFALLILVIVCLIFVRISRKVRRGGGSSIVGLGSLYDLHSKDARRAIETIVEVKAGKKLEEQESSDTID